MGEPRPCRSRSLPERPTERRPANENGPRSGSDTEGASRALGDNARVVKLDGQFPFKGEVVWLTPEQGGRTTGPPAPPDDQDYAVTGYVPPHDVQTGLASFVLRGFRHGQWRSPAEARWLIVENELEQHVEPGSVVVVTEGARAVAYFHVERIVL